MKYWIFALSLISFPFTSFAFGSLEKAAFPEKKFENREGPRTDSLLVWKDGKIVFERYARGYTPEKKHILWSVSKSVTSLIFAIAEHKGLVSRTDSICKIDSTVDKDKCQIQFQHLLQFTSGLDWVEEYEKSSRIQSASVVAMLYGEGLSQMAKFVLGHKLLAEPGKTWRYSSGDSLLLMSLFPKIFGESSIHKIVGDELMSPLGISDWTLETDPSGNGVGASFFYLRPRDLLKIGQLILNKGESNGKRLFSASWYDFLSSPPSAFKLKRFEHDGVNIGGGSFWLNVNQEVGFEKAPWPEAPKDTVVAMGHWGQYLVIIPSMNLVAVRMGDTRDGSYSVRNLLKGLMEDF